MSLPIGPPALTASCAAALHPLWNCDSTGTTVLTTAVMPPSIVIVVLRGAGMPLSASVMSLMTFAAASIAGMKPSPSDAARLLALFFMMASEPENPSDFFAASTAASPASPHWSETPFHASLDMTRALSSVSTVFERPRRVCC